MREKINIHIIAKNIRENSDYSLVEVRKFLDIIISRFRRFLKNHDVIEIRGLGTFYTKEHKARHVQLKTKIIDSKNHFVTLFKASKTLRQLVNTNGDNNDKQEQV